MADRIVVVGAGHCAGQLAARLRAEGFEGALTLVGREPHPPYQRPPLSKQFLAGEIGVERVHLRPREFYAEKGIELRLDCEVLGIDRAARTVALAGGDSVEYDRLVLATGSRVRRLPIPGTDLPGVHYLRALADSEAIRAHFAPGKRLVVVGGGYIGLEVAAVARRAGLEVAVLEMESALMARVVGPQVAAFYRRVHEAEGVAVHTARHVSGIEGEEAARAVLCVDGSRYEADLVVIGVGIASEHALAEAAGLEVEDGIRVDEFGRTSDPSVFAAGDCTQHPSRLYARRVRLESVHNAMSQGKAVAANLCGKESPYDEVPWFWSDQYDHKLQIAGLSPGYDQTVVRGEPGTGPFSVFYLADGVLLAVDTVDNLQEHVAARTLVGKSARFDPAQLADPGVPLKSLAG